MSLLRRQRKMCCRKCQRCCVRMREVVFNPEYWYSYASAGLSMWVKQSVVMAWGISESLICIMLMGTIMAVKSIVKPSSVGKELSRILPIAYSRIVCLHLVFRSLCGALCIFAASFRKVGRIKAYFGLMPVNILLTILLLLPVLEANCNCKDPAAHHSDCDVVNDISSYGFKGSASANYVQDADHMVHQSWAARLARSIGQARHMKGEDDEDDGDGGSSSRPPEDNDHPHDEKAQDYGLAEEDFAEVQKFEVLPYGIVYIREDDDDGGNATNLCSESNTGVEDNVRLKLYGAQCQKNGWKHLLSEGRALSSTLKQMKLCTVDSACKVVRVQLAAWSELRRGSENDEKQGLNTLGVRSCRILNKMPRVGTMEDIQCKCGERCPDTGLFGKVTEKCPESCDNTYIYLGFNNIHPSEAYAFPKLLCSTIVGAFLVLTSVLSLWGLAMVCVIYTFMRNRCGDVFVTEDQWEVRESTSFATTNTQMWDDDDDFSPVDVGRLASGSQAWERGSVDSARASSVSVEMEMTQRGPH